MYLQAVATMIASATHVAILDDDLSVRTAIGRVLKTLQIEVEAFATSVELFDAIERRRPDCLVLDLQMPGMNGVDVMRFPTIVITAHDEPTARSRCLDAGAAAYLGKPLDADELLKAIEMALAPRLGPSSN